jgi:hypothetical protein
MKQTENSPEPRRVSKKRRAWEDFANDRETLHAYNVRPEELVSLSRIALLGRASSKQDFLFMLNVIRRARAR